MKNEEMHTTSPLRRKRNIYSVLCSCGFLQNGIGKNSGRLYTMFREVLLETTLGSGTVTGICTDLIPFCRYLTEIHGITDITGITRSHVESYVTAVRSAYESGDKRSRDVFCANMRLTALSLMCLYLHRAGAVAEDYGLYVSVIPYPGE